MHVKSDKVLKKRKLVFLCRLFEPHIGGVEKHVAELSKVLAERGDNITIITEQYDEKLPLQEVQSAYTILRIPQQYTQSKIGIWSWILRYFNIFLAADLVHAHDVFWWYLPLRFLLPWKPVYTTFHGYEGSLPPTEKAVRSRKVSEALSNGNICIGEWMRKWYGTKPDVILYGAGSAQPKPTPQSRTAIFLGRLDEDTGVLTYIEAVKLLHGKMRLDVYGEGPLLRKIQDSIKNTNYITYKGTTKHPEAVLAHYRFACVSRYLSMIEAMQIGRYVFAQWNNAIKRDYLKSFPAIRWCSVSSLPEDIAQEMMYILGHPEREKQAVRSAQTWAAEQTWNRVADTYEELWKKSL